MNNIPEVRLGIVAVSRDCFPIALSTQRRKNIVAACEGGLYECPVTVENENDMLKAPWWYFWATSDRRRRRP